MRWRRGRRDKKKKDVEDVEDVEGCWIEACFNVSTDVVQSYF